MRRFGVHTSIGGGLHRALERAKALGCTTVQIFSHNPRGWRLNEITVEEQSAFKELRRKLYISPVFVHCSYLINIASKNEELWWKSVLMLKEEMVRADLIGADYVVLHVGSAFGDEAGGRKRAGRALKEIASEGKFRARLLLENTAGERGDIASKISELSELMAELMAKASGLVGGICFDTCHGFQAGYDIRTQVGINALWYEIDKFLGKDAVKLIHLNDSKADLGSRRDRHEHLGMGRIGEKGLKMFINHKKSANIPLILETPKKSEVDDPMNLKKLISMLGENG